MQLLQSTLEVWIKEPQRVPPPIFELLVQYFYLNEDFNRLFYILNKTKNLEQ